MSNRLFWLCALLAIGQIGLSWADDQNNTLCGKSDFYNSTVVPFSCKLGKDMIGYVRMTDSLSQLTIMLGETMAQAILV